MSEQVSAVLQPLADAIDGLDLPVDNDLLAQAFGLADRLHAKLVAAVGEHDGAEVWRNDGATSMTAWLRHRAQTTTRDATLATKTARRLRQLPVTSAAYGEGRLSGGQVQAIVANLTDRTTGLFAQHEPELVPGFGDLSVTETATRMQAWARYADAVLDDPPDTPQPQRSLHVSRILDGRRELRGSFDPEAGSLIDTAIRLATTRDVAGEPQRSPARRRAHVNVVTTLDDLEGRGQGRLIDGTILGGTTVQRLFCDAGVHRVFVAGRSSILDYGMTTRTVPANLFNALVIRDEHCRFPGCDRPPEWCEAHHVQWVTRGGPTCLENLVLECSRHHHMLHSPGWDAKLLPDATLVVTTPHGHTLQSRPAP